MPLVYAGQRVTADIESSDYTIGDVTTFAVTAASMTQLSQQFTVPAGDANVATMYRVTCWGNGTWGSTAQNLTMQMTFAGTGFGITPTIASGAFSGSAAFRWNTVMILICQTTGTLGTWHGSFWGCLTQTANNINPGTASQNTVPFVGGPSASVSQDTTVANALVLECAWASTTGGPTITCHGTTFERCGG